MKAIRDGKGAKAKEILRKIHAEDSKTMWFQIGRAMKGPRGGATMTVQKMTADGLVKESTTQGETEEVIFKETGYRFQLAMDAPISSTDLLSNLGNLADMEISQQMIEGTFDIPEEIDKATTIILEKIGSMGIEMTNGSVSNTISPEEGG